MITDSPQRQLQQACQAMDRALQSGEAVRAESWLDICPAVAADTDLALELIYSEYVARESAGSPPDPAEYYKRFPNYAERLRRLFEVDEVFKPAVTAVDHDTNADAKRATPTIAPRRVGSFEIVERLGGGGMGVVYRARQSKPHREVALKLLKSGVEAGALELARFRRESEAIARLHHENIVTVYEVGDSEGQPYLAMEYLPGGDLHAFLKGRPQSAEWAAELIAILARAVHHAHEHGIIHRDIKPANILLNADAVPKLTDFGLAALAGEAGLTRTGQVLGTLAYLAPEQAEGKEGASAPPVDVYALGAVLYECLTGRPPVLAETEAEALRQVLTVEPVAPRKLRHELPRDLNTIAMKCLRKEPTRRYDSALALAEDLERFQRGEPIHARPVGTLETVWKWTKRRPSRAALLGVSLAAIAAIVGITVSYTSRLETSLKDEDAQRQRAIANALLANEQRERAEANEQAAKLALAAETRRRAQARAALDQLTERLLEEGTRSARKNAVQIASLEAALKSYEELAKDSTRDEESRIGVATAYWKAASLANAMGRVNDAEAMIEKSLAAWKALQVDFPANFSHFRSYGVMLNDRGTMRSSQGRHEEAIVDFRESFELQKKYPGDAKDLHNIYLGTTVYNLSLSCRRLKQTDDANQFESVAIELWESFVTATPNDQRYRNGLARCLQQRALRFQAAGDRDAARSDYRRAMDLRTPEGKLTTVDYAIEEQADCHEQLAAMAIGTNDVNEHYREALKLREKIFTNNPSVNAHFQSVVKLLNHLYFRPDFPAGDLEAVFARLRPRLLARAATENEPVMLVQAGGVACNHGNLLARVNRTADALKAYDDGIAVLELALRIQANHTAGRMFLANTLAGKANVLKGLERYLDAAKCLERSLQFESRAPRRQLLATERAAALARGGELAEALTGLDSLDAPAVGKIYARAGLYAMIVERCKDSELRVKAETQALAWLGKARGAGELKNKSIRDNLKTDADWAAMRNLHGVEVLLEGAKD